MFNTSILEVVIGLIFVFSLMAILVTQINGIITTLLNLRAKQLKRGLQNLVTDKLTQARLLAHPIIKMVDVSLPPQVQLTDPVADKIVTSEETRVNYIPPSTFVEAMMGILIAESDRSLYRKLNQAINNMPSCAEQSELRELLQHLRADFSEGTVRSIRAVTDRISDDACREELLAGLEDLEITVSQLRFKGAQLVPLLNGIRTIDDPNFKAALETVLVTARSLDEARFKLEAWFNDSMERVSEAFRQRLQFYSIIVAFVLTLIFNVDTVYLARTLWENQELRQTVAAAAAQFEQTGVIPQPSETTVEISPDDENAGQQDEATLEELQSRVEDAGATVQRLLELQLPIGWQHTAVTDEMIASSQRLGMADPRTSGRNIWNYWPPNNPSWLTLWLQKIVGILATTIAASQGAPFWFDLLNRLTKR
jgi:hypothetical protein